MTLDKREFLMLAQEWEPKKHFIGSWWASIKLDGMRCLWDGGISRGIPATEVPWANVAKDARYLSPPVSTGLWTRYGKTLQAPDWWLDGLPRNVNLDCELWMGNGTFQKLMSTVKQLVPVDDGWKSVVAHALDAPSWEQVLVAGQLTGTNFKGILHEGMLEWVREHTGGPTFPGFGPPDECFSALPVIHSPEATWVPHHQEKLPKHPDDAVERVQQMLHEVTSVGGEGLVLRNPAQSWYPKRVNGLLKAKKLSDAEGTVVGFTWGRITALGSRHLGRMGALILDYVGKRLELSGFTDEERQIGPAEHHVPEWTHLEGGVVPSESISNEGKDASAAWECVAFPRGSKVTFTYREFSKDGIPKEARYLRCRPDGV